MNESKNGNPKDAVGCKKLPLDLVPDTAVAHQAAAHLHGALKYGPYNWRVAGVRSSIYVAACRRHVAAWWNGEDEDPESGLNHLAHALACLNIILDAEECDKLNDDRPTPAPVREMTDGLNYWVADQIEKKNHPKCSGCGLTGCSPEGCFFRHDEEKKTTSPPVPVKEYRTAWVTELPDPQYPVKKHSWAYLGTDQVKWGCVFCNLPMSEAQHGRPCSG